MQSRRRFLNSTAAAAVVSQSVLGANDRVQMAIIGTGNRGTQVHRAFTRHNDAVFIGACDVAWSRMDAFVSQAGGKLATYSDYRRVLENKDVDAVLVSTPDHWHSPIAIDACMAGKDVYVEKPVSNAIDAAIRMVDAVRRTNRVVQVGIQQRSWHHFGECARMMRAGILGRVNHCLILFSGGSVANRNLSNTPQDPPPISIGMRFKALLRDTRTHRCGSVHGGIFGITAAASLRIGACIWSTL